MTLLYCISIDVTLGEQITLWDVDASVLIREKTLSACTQTCSIILTFKTDKTKFRNGEVQDRNHSKGRSAFFFFFFTWTWYNLDIIKYSARCFKVSLKLIYLLIATSSFLYIPVAKIIFNVLCHLMTHSSTLWGYPWYITGQNSIGSITKGTGKKKKKAQNDTRFLGINRVE